MTMTGQMRVIVAAPVIVSLAKIYIGTTGGAVGGGLRFLHIERNRGRRPHPVARHAQVGAGLADLVGVDVMHDAGARVALRGLDMHDTRPNGAATDRNLYHVANLRKSAAKIHRHWRFMARPA